ncbi:hypothetical protein [Candidatus Ichthyocystis sparus]|nr:hypothetical protein [Candidatus Ichthyocystis sparus]
MMHIVRSIINTSRPSLAEGRLGKFSIEASTYGCVRAASRLDSTSNIVKRTMQDRDIRVLDTGKEAKVSALSGASQIVCEFEKILTKKK